MLSTFERNIACTAQDPSARCRANRYYGESTLSFRCPQLDADKQASSLTHEPCCVATLMNLHDKVRGGSGRPVPQLGARQSRTTAGPCNLKLKIFSGHSFAAGVLPSFPARYCRSRYQGLFNHPGPAAVGGPTRYERSFPPPAV